MTAVPANEKDLVEAFYNFDRDQDGFLTADELRDVLLDQGLHMSATEVEEVIQVADINKDGYIDYKAFAHLLLTELES
ncbi:calmodulin [Pelomyxa schiedti]|nr:calmodulin [Pelomyxa schiedti]